MKDDENAPTVNVGANVMDNSEAIKTDGESINGQDKCPKCGATDIYFNINSGKLRCNFCRYEFSFGNASGILTDIGILEGQVMTSGVSNIEVDSSDFITLKCSSCGAEVVIDTSSSMQARCHWCRNTLSINEQVPNGSVPDVVLPFSITKNDARVVIERFVGKRKFFAHPKFRKEFTTSNIMGVYFSYMLVDINSHAFLSGQGETHIRSYTVGSGNNQRTYYDADLFNVSRDFDLVISDLSIESSLDKLDRKNNNKTTNIINSIMPFDTENCIRYNANYLKGYTSEKRDINVDVLRPIVNEQAKDIARFAANDSLKQYDRGVAWSNENLDIKGQQWKAAYLPVWLYSYQEVKGNKKLLHYVAVNARTREVMGSVPIHMPVLIGVSLFVEIIGIIIFLLFEPDSDIRFLFLFTGIIYYLIMYNRYRNGGERHKYETETKRKVKNLVQKDEFVKRENGLSNSMIKGVNNKRVGADSVASKVLNSLTENNDVVLAINQVKKEFKK